MAIWLVRAGSRGEYEQKFIQERRVYVTWDGLDVDLNTIDTRDTFVALMGDRYPEEKSRAISNWASQIWPFARLMKQGDWVVMPLKSQPAVYIGQICSDYQFSANGPDPFFHWRDVEWIGEAVPRSHFGQDLLYSFGAFMTICRIQRNNAEARLKAMYENGWARETTANVLGKPGSSTATEVPTAEDGAPDLEEAGQELIARLIEARFKGHGLTRLVESILQAQGYTTWRSPEGADGGADILAANGAMGFGGQRLCVEVKSGSSPESRETVDKLLGAMTKFNASEGLFVSWGGYKGNVQKELASSFFRLRLWGRRELLEQLFANYDALSAEVKAELPLKRIWTVAADDDL
jgi:restriction system protein